MSTEVGLVQSQQSIRILVAATLPGTVRITEINTDVDGEGKTFVVRHFFTPVPGQRLVELLRQLASVVDQGINDGFGVFAGNLHQHHITRMALNQGSDLAIGIAEHRIPFPMAGYCPILDGSWPFTNRNCVGDAAVVVRLLRVVPRPAHGARTPQMFQ
jgi:hypothetical protein